MVEGRAPEQEGQGGERPPRRAASPARAAGHARREGGRGTTTKSRVSGSWVSRRCTSQGSRRRARARATDRGATRSAARSQVNPARTRTRRTSATSAAPRNRAAPARYTRAPARRSRSIRSRNSPRSRTSGPATRTAPARRAATRARARAAGGLGAEVGSLARRWRCRARCRQQSKPPRGRSPSTTSTREGPPGGGPKRKDSSAGPEKVRGSARTASGRLQCSAVPCVDLVLREEAGEVGPVAGAEVQPHPERAGGAPERGRRPGSATTAASSSAERAFMGAGTIAPPPRHAHSGASLAPALERPRPHGAAGLALLLSLGAGLRGARLREVALELGPGDGPFTNGFARPRPDAFDPYEIDGGIATHWTTHDARIALPLVVAEAEALGVRLRFARHFADRGHLEVRLAGQEVARFEIGRGYADYDATLSRPGRAPHPRPRRPCRRTSGASA